MLADEVPIGPEPPRLVYAIIETPLGSRIKYAAAKDHSAMVVSKVLPSTFAYPANTGFFARCQGEDGDPLDAMVLGDTSLAVGSVAAVRPIAVMRMTDRGDRDDKVICVLQKDADWRHAKTLSDIPTHVRQAFETFHQTYRKQEGTQRSVRLQGWAGVQQAHRLVRDGHRRFVEQHRQPSPQLPLPARHR